MFKHLTHSPNEELEPLSCPGKASGFVSPAEDYMEGRLNILERLVKDPVNTYYAEATTDELINLGISKGTLFVYDTSIKAKHHSLVIVWYRGEWKVRQLYLIGKQVFLGTGKDTEAPERIDANELLIRGVVTWSCRPHQAKPRSYVRTR